MSTTLVSHNADTYLQELFAAEAAFGKQKIRTLATQFFDVLEFCSTLKTEVNHALNATEPIDYDDYAVRLEKALSEHNEWITDWQLLPNEIKGNAKFDAWIDDARSTATVRNTKHVCSEFKVQLDRVKQHILDEEKMANETKKIADEKYRCELEIAKKQEHEKDIEAIKNKNDSEKLHDVIRNMAQRLDNNKKAMDEIEVAHTNLVNEKNISLDKLNRSILERNDRAIFFHAVTSTLFLVFSSIALGSMIVSNRDFHPGFGVVLGIIFSLTLTIFAGFKNAGVIVVWSVIISVITALNFSAKLIKFGVVKQYYVGIEFPIYGGVLALVVTAWTGYCWYQHNQT
jgi:hypothetical protein